MAETVGSGGARVPQTFGEKLGFCFPAILVTLILAVGIGFAITMIINNQTKAELNETIAKLDKRLSDELSVVKKNLDQAQKDVVALQADTKALNEAKVAMSAKLDGVDKAVATVGTDLGNFRKGQEVQDANQNKDIAKTATDVSALDRRVIYVEEKLKKLAELEADIKVLKNDTAGLKKDYEILSADLKAVRNKADVTEKDLSVLGERTKQFQLRVLHARAREAAEAARTMDLKTLLSRLEDVEGK